MLEGRAYLHRVMVVLPRHWRTHLQDQDIEEGAGLAARRPDVLVVDSGQICKSCSVLPTTLARTKKSLKNLFLEKIIIPPQKSIPFNVIKRVQ